MKQIIPFVKDLNFSTRVCEITSIALEHNLQMENNDSIVGTFIVSGKYKMNDISINEESFENDIPFDITLDDKYDASKVMIDIDDFYYEILNEETLRVHIDVVVNNLVYYKADENTSNNEERSQLIRNDDKEYQKFNEEDTETIYMEEKQRENIMPNEIETPVLTSLSEEENLYIPRDDVKKENIQQNVESSLQTSFLGENENYSTYKVHIIRENETIETIKETYSITEEELEKYNSLDKIMLGTKLIIPTKDE